MPGILSDVSVTDAVHTRAHADLAERARRVLPGGATHASRTYDPRIYVARSSGSRKWLIDGTELIDYTMGHGALLLGHAHPAVVAAVQRAGVAWDPLRRCASARGRVGGADHVARPVG